MGERAGDGYDAAGGVAGWGGVVGGKQGGVGGVFVGWGGKCGRSFGGVEVGAMADVVGLDADWREDEGALRRVAFVMKDGRVWKEGGG